jgi:hypothetical protein
MFRMLSIACLVLAAQGCVAARQAIHGGLSSVTKSDYDLQMRSQMGDSDWHRYQAEEQNVAAVEYDLDNR